MGVVALGINLALLNLGLGFLLYKYFFVKPQQNLNTTNFVDICDLECEKKIDQRFKSLESNLKIAFPTPKSAPTPTPIVVYKTVEKPKTKNVVYLPVPGTGSSTESSWTDLSGTDFYFDTRDYPGLISIYFEANIKLFNGNGMAYVRFFDVTHGIGVQGSDVSTSSQTSTPVESGMVTFWSGKNLIRVQAKSLTADTAVFEGGRLKITYEN